MEYNKEYLEEILQQLIGKELIDCYYYSHYEGFTSFDNLPEDIQPIPLLGLVIKTSPDLIFQINGTEYSPYYGLGGIEIGLNKSVENPRPGHINEQKWLAYKGKKITSYEVYENVYKKGVEKITIPFGINLTLEGDLRLYIFNISLEEYNDSEKNYDFSRGGNEITMFFNKNIVDSCHILNHSITNI